MEELYFETLGELEAYVLEYFLSDRSIQLDELNNPIALTPIDITKDIVDFLLARDIVFVEELNDPCDGCEGCDESPEEEKPTETDKPSGQTTNQ